MEIRSGCQEKLFYHAYDLALAIESLEGKLGKKHRILKGWREDENDNCENTERSQRKASFLALFAERL